MLRLIAQLAMIMDLALAGSFFRLETRTLKGVFEPGMIKIADGKTYVVEGANILVFSLQDLSLIRQFGKQGEGPGELKVADFWYNSVTVLPGQIFVDGYDKVVYFSKEGQLIREAKKPVGISQMAPVGDNFAAIKLDHIEGDVQYQCLYLYDSELEFMRELCRQESPIQSVTGKTEMIPDVLNFAVWGEMIFVEKSRSGFVVEVFDSKGKQLYQIEKEHEKIPIKKDHMTAALEKFKNDPFLKRIGFEEFKKFSEFVWPDSLPAIRDFMVADSKMYVRTSRTRDEKENWMVLDLDGRTLANVFVPRLDSAPLMATLYGVNYYTIHKDTIYFLKYNEKSDQWELHTQEAR